jgi:hypothetical protein
MTASLKLKFLSPVINGDTGMAYMMKSSVRGAAEAKCHTCKWKKSLKYVSFKICIVPYAVNLLNKTIAYETVLHVSRLSIILSVYIALNLSQIYLNLIGDKQRVQIALNCGQPHMLWRTGIQSDHFRRSRITERYLLIKTPCCWTDS